MGASRASDSKQVGLRHRLQRIAGQVEHQHHALERLEEALRDAVARAAGAAPACAHYRDALFAHFELEERLFFPALHGFDRSSETSLIALQDAHTALRRELEQLQEHISQGADGVAPALTQLFVHLHDHEQREQALWARLAP